LGYGGVRKRGLDICRTRREWGVGKNGSSSLLPNNNRWFCRVPRFSIPRGGVLVLLHTISLAFSHFVIEVGSPACLQPRKLSHDLIATAGQDRLHLGPRTWFDLQRHPISSSSLLDPSQKPSVHRHSSGDQQLPAVLRSVLAKGIAETCAFPSHSVLTSPKGSEERSATEIGEPRNSLCRSHSEIRGKTKTKYNIADRAHVSRFSEHECSSVAACRDCELSWLRDTSMRSDPHRIQQ
jgi:hypothetical protein